MTFLQTAASTHGALLQIETWNPHGESDPEHIHVGQESTAEILEGSTAVSIRGAVQRLAAGDKVVIPANTPHQFLNEHSDEVRMLQEFRPALRLEDFFESYFAMSHDGKLDQQGMSSLLQMSVMIPEFGDVIRPASPPWPILRAILWPLAPIARARGYKPAYTAA
jgi:gentisate 1,2-dioxygenase